MTARQKETTDSTGAALLVERAAAGDSGAWERLVDKYAKLISTIAREFKLVESDAADVAQVTWMRLLEHIDRLEYPDRVGSWLAATARHECLRSLAARKKIVLADDERTLNTIAGCGPELDERLLAAERAQSVRDALSHLPRQWQRLLHLLMAEPPVSYAEISDQLGLPVGSIGPTRQRCLAKLRRLLAEPGPPQPRRGGTPRQSTGADEISRRQRHGRTSLHSPADAHWSPEILPAKSAESGRDRADRNWLRIQPVGLGQALGYLSSATRGMSVRRSKPNASYRASMRHVSE